jgi:hypothetical protein
MGAKGYVFIKFKDTVTPNLFLDIRSQLETIDEVKGFESVIDVDWFDMLARVEDGIMVSNVAHKIQDITGIASAQPARIMLGPEY